MTYLQRHLTKIIIILFSVAILLGFAGYLYVNTEDSQAEFYSSQQTIAVQATQTVAREIERFFAQKEKLLKSFAEDNQQLLDSLISEPDNEKLFQKLNNKLSRYFLDFYSTTLATSEGQPLIDDFDGYLGELCIADMKQYIETGSQQTRVHPHPKVYHYDVVIKLASNNKDYLFLVSFNLDSLASILKLSSPDDQSLFLMQKELENLIEITEDGSRLNIPKRLDYRMQQQELERVLSESPVSGTRWYVLDLIKPGVLEKHRKETGKRNLLVYMYVVILVIIFTALLLNQVCKNIKVADDLRIKNKEVEVLNSILRDKNKELSEQATTDALTKLFNRRYFDERVVEEWSRASRLWLPFNIAFIDIDYFKQYNDLYGHQLGDICLKTVAELLSGYFKRSNEFVARYGGEEFAVVNIGSKPDFFKICIQEAINLLAEKNIEHKGSQIATHLTMSIGIASTSDAKSTSSDIMIGVADDALYEAKNKGRNQVVQLKVDS